jgi:hypothetical protein
MVDRRGIDLIWIKNEPAHRSGAKPRDHMRSLPPTLGIVRQPPLALSASRYRKVTAAAIIPPALPALTVPDLAVPCLTGRDPDGAGIRASALRRWCRTSGQPRAQHSISAAPI